MPEKVVPLYMAADPWNLLLDPIVHIPGLLVVFCLNHPLIEVIVDVICTS